MLTRVLLFPRVNYTLAPSHRLADLSLARTSIAHCPYIIHPDSRRNIVPNYTAANYNSPRPTNW